jgi:hypothetical protein
VAKLTTAIPGLAGGAAYPQALDEALIGDGAELPERRREMYEAPRRAIGLARPEVG